MDEREPGTPYANDEQVLEELQVLLCQIWIKHFTKEVKHIKKDHTSYHWKHVVENFCGTYISNDAFKIAADREYIKSAPADSHGKNRCYAFTDNIDSTVYRKFGKKNMQDIVNICADIELIKQYIRNKKELSDPSLLKCDYNNLFK